MIATIILVLLAFLSLVLLIRLTKGRSLAPNVLEDPEKYLRSVDLDAFRNLVDPDEERYLRISLPAADFRQLQRERLRAAIEYISSAAENAAILLRLGEAARRSSDPATAAAAVKLIDNAIRLRLYAFQAMPRLYIAMLLPSARIAPVRVVESYEQMTRQVILLGLKYPAGAVSSGL